MKKLQVIEQSEAPRNKYVLWLKGTTLYKYGPNGWMSLNTSKKDDDNVDIEGLEDLRNQISALNNTLSTLSTKVSSLENELSEISNVKGITGGVLNLDSNNILTSGYLIDSESNHLEITINKPSSVRAKSTLGKIESK